MKKRFYGDYEILKNLPCFISLCHLFIFLSNMIYRINKIITILIFYILLLFLHTNWLFFKFIISLSFLNQIKYVILFKINAHKLAKKDISYTINSEFCNFLFCFSSNGKVHTNWLICLMINLMHTNWLITTHRLAKFAHRLAKFAHRLAKNSFKTPILSLVQTHEILYILLKLKRILACTTNSSFAHKLAKRNLICAL